MPDLLNGISNTHFVPCFTKAFWVHGTRDNAFLTIGRKEVFWQQALTCLSFIPDSMWEGGGEREWERGEKHCHPYPWFWKWLFFRYCSITQKDLQMLDSLVQIHILSLLLHLFLLFHQPITHMHTNWSCVEYSKLLSVSGVRMVSPGILFPRLMKVKYKYQI